MLNGAKLVVFQGLTEVTTVKTCPGVIAENVPETATVLRNYGIRQRGCLTSCNFVITIALAVDLWFDERSATATCD
jgi:hypothetical protein